MPAFIAPISRRCPASVGTWSWHHAPGCWRALILIAVSTTRGIVLECDNYGAQRVRRLHGLRTMQCLSSVPALPFEIRKPLPLPPPVESTNIALSRALLDLHRTQPLLS